MVDKYIYKLRVRTYFMWFMNKKAPEVVEPTFQERLKRLETKVMRQETEILDLIGSYDILKNKILKKIQSTKKPEEEETDNELVDKDGFLKTKG